MSAGLPAAPARYAVSSTPPPRRRRHRVAPIHPWGGWWSKPIGGVIVLGRSARVSLGFGAGRVAGTTATGTDASAGRAGGRGDAPEGGRGAWAVTAAGGR